MTDNTAEPTPTDTVAAIFVRHPLWEDALALLFGTALVATDPRTGDATLRLTYR